MYPTRSERTSSPSWPRLRAGLDAVIDGQRGHLFPWAPVFVGTGIAIYFALASEPGFETWVAMGATFGLCLAILARVGLRAPLVVAVALILSGVMLGGLRTWAVAAPVLDYRYYGPIEGRIVVVDRSASDKVRLTLDRVHLSKLAPADTPGRVRVSLHGDQRFLVPRPGLTVVMTGHLSPPRGPVEPGGFDFQRHAWFQGIGAVGYTRTPALALAEPVNSGPGLWVHGVRMKISAHVQSVLPGRAGAFAAAITTGDRSGMDAETLEHLRISNLAHLLAISGLHMGMLTGFVFGTVRLGLALVPHTALYWPTHKIAAVAALTAGVCYLALSGGNVATERAFIMVAVMLVAVLFDQRALTLRAVALAALIVMLRRPEAVLGPGFQMSFAATAALIAVFSAMRDIETPWFPRVARWVLALVVSSAVAGLATAPFAAAHFNRVPHYGLIANILSVPVMGSLVMPAAVLAAVLAPFGGSWLGLKIMAPAIGWILAVAARVSSWEGAASHVPAPQGAVLPLVALGGLWLILWQGRARGLGLVSVCAAFLLWSGVERPHLLISDTGGLVGLQTDSGRALSKPKGEGFAALNWLENDGDPAAQAVASNRWPGDAGQFTLGGKSWRLETGRGAAERAIRACARVDYVITSAEIARNLRGPCRMFDRQSLTASGAISVTLTGADLAFRSTWNAENARPWSAPSQ